MLETLFLATLIYLFLTRTKKKRKLRTLDAELKELIQDSNDATAISLEIKRYLLDVIRDDKESALKFAPARINQAQHILDRAGPGAFYWMTEIAAQLSILSAAQINGVPTNVNEALGESATPEAIIEVVIKS
jgi:hypothetical protein